MNLVREAIPCMRPDDRDLGLEESAGNLAGSPGSASLGDIGIDCWPKELGHLGWRGEPSCVSVTVRRAYGWGKLSAS